MSALLRCRVFTPALGVAALLSFGAVPVCAQHADHSKIRMPAAAPAQPAQREAETAPAKKTSPRKAAPPPAASASENDAHADHVRSAPEPEPEVETVDHAAMGHGMPVGTDEPAQQEPVDHTPSGHMLPLARAYQHEPPGEDTTTGSPRDSSQAVDHAAMGHAMPTASAEPRTPIPVLTDADRKAAFPPVTGHTAHDRRIHSYWLVDRLESYDADHGTAVEWEALSWIGGDIDRLWLRSEGEWSGGSTESADIEVFYGRNIARWWDAVVGVRQDFGEGPSQTFVAFGVMGLSPYKFEVEATAYIGQSGQTALRLEAEYDTLLTNRLILQWLAEAELHGRNDRRRGVGSGLGTVEAGLRLRYEITRQFAPYIGVVWERAFGNTADFRRVDGHGTDDTRIVAGVRFWF